jgi:hypothetical protein
MIVLLELFPSLFGRTRANPSCDPTTAPCGAVHPLQLGSEHRARSCAAQAALVALCPLSFLVKWSFQSVAAVMRTSRPRASTTEHIRSCSRPGIGQAAARSRCNPRPLRSIHPRCRWCSRPYADPRRRLAGPMESRGWAALRMISRPPIGRVSSDVPVSESRHLDGARSGDHSHCVRKYCSVELTLSTQSLSPRRSN